MAHTFMAVPVLASATPLEPSSRASGFRDPLPAPARAESRPVTPPASPESSVLRTKNFRRDKCQEKRAILHLFAGNLRNVGKRRPRECYTGLLYFCRT